MRCISLVIPLIAMYSLGAENNVDPIQIFHGFAQSELALGELAFNEFSPEFSLDEELNPDELALKETQDFVDEQSVFDDELNDEWVLKGTQGFIETEQSGCDEELNSELALKETQNSTADGQRGFVAPLSFEKVPSKREIKSESKSSQFFLQKERKEAKPVLTNQTKTQSKPGLFKLIDGIYQVRLADLSSMTILEGLTSILIVDPLASQEAAKLALDLYYQNRPQKPISHVIYTHSRTDLFHGVTGIVSQEDVASGKIKVIAPQGFIQAALENNMMAHNVRLQAAQNSSLFLIGSKMQEIKHGSSSSLILPTHFVEKSSQNMTLDGVECQFIFASDSDSPPEMLFFLPAFKAIYVAQDAGTILQNLYTVKGAKICGWSKYLNQALDLFGSRASLVFGQLHLPRWGQSQVVNFLEKQRDLYKYLHDQTLRLANQGYTIAQIGEMIQLPESLSKEISQKGFKESLHHHAKAVYNHYLGWFEANPSQLHPLPQSEASKKYVEYMGGSEAVLQKAEKDFALGNYRWAAEVLNHIVFAEPSNKKARTLLADTLDKLGFESENGIWKNLYLSGAQEIREGAQKKLAPATLSSDMIQAMSTEILINYLAIHLNGPKAAQKPLAFNFNFPDKQERFVIEVKNGTLNYFPNKNLEIVKATVTLNRADFNDLILGKTHLHVLKNAKKIQITGSEETLNTFLSLLDQFESWFNSPESKKGV